VPRPDQTSTLTLPWSAARTHPTRAHAALAGRLLLHRPCRLPVSP
jgi:hypothetical protein